MTCIRTNWHLADVAKKAPPSAAPAVQGQAPAASDCHVVAIGAQRGVAQRKVGQHVPAGQRRSLLPVSENTRACVARSAGRLLL